MEPHVNDEHAKCHSEHTHPLSHTHPPFHVFARSAALARRPAPKASAACANIILPINPTVLPAEPAGGLAEECPRAASSTTRSTPHRGRSRCHACSSPPAPPWCRGERRQPRRRLPHRQRSCRCGSHPCRGPTPPTGSCPHALSNRRWASRSSSAPRASLMSLPIETAHSCTLRHGRTRPTAFPLVLGAHSRRSRLHSRICRNQSRARHHRSRRR